MQNSISHWQRMLLQEVEEKQLSPKQQKIAKLDPPKDKLDAGDFAALRDKKGLKKEVNTPNPPTDHSGKPSISGLGPIVDMEESEDHEVSMANNSLESIVKAAMELKAKLGDNEKDIPAWIQDHITNAANFISQAAENYHEYGDHEVEDIPVNGALDQADSDKEEMSLQKIMEKMMKNGHK